MEGLRGSDIDPALLLYKADALMSLELEEKQDVIISCVQRGKRVSLLFYDTPILHFGLQWYEIDC